MSLIPGTNILVDKFSQTSNDINSYVYFLSHFHTDHYSELYDQWDLGIIYMSEDTRKLLVNLYPSLKIRTFGLELNQPHQIYIDKDKTETVQVTLFDSNHCPGAVMMLFEGKMGRVIHTGDFRFTEEMFNYHQLFPPELMNKERLKCSIEIDHLIMDATFADPVKDHPPKQEAYEAICRIINKHKNFRVFLFVYLLGKEEVFAGLAKQFKTKIVVDEDRYSKIKILNIEPELYTTDPEEGWIHVRTKEERKHMDIEKYNEECPTIFISMSGRGTDDTCSKRYIYRSQYSSHSNAKELEMFVRAIYPKRISFHSQPDYLESRKFRAYLAKEYTQEGFEVSMASINNTKGAKSSNKLVERKYENAILDRFSDEVVAKINKREFYKQNPFMERKRKRFSKTGAKLINSKPILSLSDEEEEKYADVKEEQKVTLKDIQNVKSSCKDEGDVDYCQYIKDEPQEDDTNKRRRKSKRKEKDLDNVKFEV